MRLDVILAARYLLTIVRRVALNDYAMCWVVGAFHMMVKEERRKFKGQNGSRYEAAGSTQLLPKSATMSRAIGYSMRAVVMQCLLFAIFLLLLAPGLSSAALPSVEALPPITDHLKWPSGIAVGDDEKIYVASSNDNQLHVFSKSGQHQASIEGLNGPAAVAVDNAGRIYIGNAGRGNVEVYDSNLSPIGKLGSGDGEFRVPIGIAVDSSTGLIYVVDGREHKVKIYNADYSSIGSFGDPGSAEGHFQTPTSIVINEVAGEILIPDFHAANNLARVQVFDLNGAYLRGFAATGADEQGDPVAFTRPFGIAIDTLERIYITDGLQNVVTVYSPEGGYLGRFDGGRPLQSPQKIAFAPTTSRLFVASLNTHTVETFGIDGLYGHIAVSPQSHSFADVAVNDASPSQSFELSNNGNGNLAVGSITLTGVDASEFTIVSNNCTDQTLVSTEECAIDVQLKPLSVGSKSAALSIVSDDLYVPTLNVALSGHAEPQHVPEEGSESSWEWVDVLSPITYSITASAGNNGSISPEGVITADARSTVTFEITADSGYRISDVRVDGVSIGAMDSYSFEDLLANHEITADFVAADAFSLASIETGEVSVGDQWKRVDLSNTFVNPVVVVKPASRNDPSSAVIRVRNVDAQGFEVRIQEWGYLPWDGDDEAHAEEQVGYVVMEKGSYTLKDGIRIEAGQFNTDAMSSFGAVGFDQPFAVTPVVMSSVVTYNKDVAVIGRMGNIDVAGFGYMLQEEELNSVPHDVETVSFIAWEPSQASQDGISFEVRAIDDALTLQTEAIEFNGSYLSQPVLLADLQTTNGDVVNLRWSDKTTRGVNILLDQEDSNNAFARLLGNPESTLVSSPEKLGYLALLPVNHILTVEKSGSGSGQVQAEGIDCGADCSENYSNGTSVTLSAVAAEDSIFAGWSGGGCSGTDDCTVTMNQAATTVTAVFNTVAAPSYALTVVKDGSGDGQVQIEGVDCGADCSEDYSDGTSVTLSAEAAAGSVFAGWSGVDCDDDIADCAVTMEQAITVTASFDINPTPAPAGTFYTITVSAGENGSISPATISKEVGSTVTFNVTADAGYAISDVQVDDESVDLVGNTYSFRNLNADHKITADFEVAEDTFGSSSIEMGEVTVGDEWKRVQLSNTFVSPVVVVKPASRSDVDPAVVRVRDVGAQSFEVRIQEWDYLDGTHAEEQVGYIVMEKGSYTLGDGARVEAGQFESNVLSASFARPFAVAPVVISSVVTDNDDTPVVVRMSNIGITGFDYQLQEEARNDWVRNHPVETVSFIAWEPGYGYQDRIDYEVGRIDSVEPSQSTLIEFNENFVPSLFVADLQTTNGGVVNLRWNQGSDTDKGVSVLVDPERSDLDSVSSSSEEIGYLLLKFDSDCDGLSDKDEINIYTTDPLKADTDGDGMTDGFEVYYWIGTRWGDDPDEDGKPNILDIDSDNNGNRDKSYEPVGDGEPTKITVTCQASISTAEREALMGEGGIDFSVSDDNKPRMGSARGEAAFDQRPGFSAPTIEFGRSGVQVDRPNVGFDRSGVRFDN